MSEAKPTPREIAEELLNSYCETLYYYELAVEHYEVDSPGAFHLFEMVMDLMEVPSRDELHRLRLPSPDRPGDYWTRDELVKEFHRLYDDKSIPDEKFIASYLDLLESLSGKGPNRGSTTSMAQA
jgi:hypothetical protein